VTAIGRREFLKLRTQEPSSDLAIVNSRMVTMDERRPEAQAALVTGSRIALVGTTDEVRSRAGNARLFDAGGRVVVPGFVDAHAHFELTCLGSAFQAACHTPPYTSLREIVKVLKSKASDTPKGQWVMARIIQHAGEVGNRRSHAARARCRHDGPSLILFSAAAR
jgi:predicted amidohydrolase YtcJ